MPADPDSDSDTEPGPDPADIATPVETLEGERSPRQFGPLPPGTRGATATAATERRFLPGQDVAHDEFGTGWVQGSGLGRVTVRFENPWSGPGRIKTVWADDEALHLVDAATVARATLAMLADPDREPAADRESAADLDADTDSDSNPDLGSDTNADLGVGADLGVDHDADRDFAADHNADPDLDPDPSHLARRTPNPRTSIGTMTDEPTKTEVVDNELEDRFELWHGDRLAGFAAYRRREGATVFVHTEIEPEFEGKGLASVLARQALDATVARGEQIIPVCPFIAAYLRKHPEYQDHVQWPAGPGADTAAVDD